jgi:hypothetical protein
LAPFNYQDDFSETLSTLNRSYIQSIKGISTSFDFTAMHKTSYQKNPLRFGFGFGIQKNFITENSIVNVENPEGIINKVPLASFLFIFKGVLGKDFSFAQRNAFANFIYDRSFGTYNVFNTTKMHTISLEIGLYF